MSDDKVLVDELLSSETLNEWEIGFVEKCAEILEWDVQLSPLKSKKLREIYDKDLTRK